MQMKPHSVSHLPTGSNRTPKGKFSYAVIFSVLLLAFLCIPTNSQTQSRKELEKERKHILDEIRETKKQLKDVSVKKRQSMEYLRLLQRQISNRESLIETMQDELVLINQGIAESSDIVAALENDLDALRQEYARLIYYYYKNRGHYSLLSFVFSANSFHEAYSRMKLLRFYAEYRKKQIELIVKTENSLMERMTDLRKKQAEKVQVLHDLDEQKKDLEDDQDDQKNLIASLRHQGTELQKDLKVQQEAADRLERSIKNAIQTEIANARAKEKERNKRNNKGTKKETTTTARNREKEDEEMPMSPEAKALSDKFASNKGRLPWPVVTGMIPSAYHFGRQPHPTLPGIFVNNNGVKFKTPDNSVARAIFDGEVRAIMPIDAQRKFILIKHGDYFTVYSNIKIPLVKTGQRVSTKQEIGIVAQDPDNKKTMLEFQIWKGGNTKLNPENWLAK